MSHRAGPWSKEKGKRLKEKQKTRDEKNSAPYVIARSGATK